MKKRRLYAPALPRATVPGVMPSTPDKRHGRRGFACANVVREENSGSAC